MTFTDKLIDDHSDLWKEMLTHSFLQDLRDNNLDQEKFYQWLRQDYEFVKAALPFVSIIKPKAPENHVRPLSEAEVALHEELDLFEERAEALDVDVADVPRNLTTQSYIQHLIATGYREDYPVSLTVYWAAEKAYHESWKQVEPAFPEDHDFYPFIQNWAGEAFEEFVNFLTDSLDNVAKNATKTKKSRMAEHFQLTVRYEIAFWDMAYGNAGDEWVLTRENN